MLREDIEETIVDSFGRTISKDRRIGDNSDSRRKSSNGSDGQLLGYTANDPSGFNGGQNSSYGGSRVNKFTPVRSYAADSRFDDYGSNTYSDPSQPAFYDQFNNNGRVSEAKNRRVTTRFGSDGFHSNTRPDDRVGIVRHENFGGRDLERSFSAPFNNDGDRPYDNRRNSNEWNPPRNGPAGNRGYGNQRADGIPKRRDEMIDNSAMHSMPINQSANPFDKVPKLIPMFAPLMSFKSFMQNQSEDLPPLQFQKMYDLYNLQYLQDFSAAFFNASMHEEWFQDRYNPLNIQKIESQSVDWAHKESSCLKLKWCLYPMQSVNAVSLDPVPSTHQDDRQVKHLSTMDEKKAEEKLDLSNKNETIDPPQATENDFDPSVCGPHLPGHTDRTIYIFGIPASCPKSIFKEAVMEALTKYKAPTSDDVPTKGPGPKQDEQIDGAEKNQKNSSKPMSVDRILIAQPTWSNRIPSKFERCAWVVMSNASELKVAFNCLRDLTVHIPNPIDPISETSDGSSSSFTIQAVYHNAKNFKVLPEFTCHSARIKIDTKRALELVALLDEDRAVSVENRLASILSDEKLIDAMSKPTDALDLAVAYLRRVHFVTFYGGKRFRDEAHLLTLAPCIMRRPQPFIPANDFVSKITPPPPTEPRPDAAKDASLESSAAEVVPTDLATKGGTDKKEADVVVKDAVAENDDSVNAKTAIKEEILETTEKEYKASTEEGEEIEESTIQNALTAGSATSHSRDSPRIPLADRRIEVMINELKSKLNRKKNEADSIGTPEEVDAKILEEANEKSFEECIRYSCKFEKEGKCRCCYALCNKLFKGVEFLKKHIKTKHEHFAIDAYLRDAKPFMLKRYEAEELLARPLPPVQIEARGGIELTSVKDILDKCSPKAIPPPQMHVPLLGSPYSINNGEKIFTPRSGQQSGRYPRSNSNQFGRDNWHRDNGDSRERHLEDAIQNMSGKRRGTDDFRNSHEHNPLHRDGSDRNSMQPPSITPTRVYVEPKSEDNYSRKLPSYLDVDAPKVSVDAIDYGVIIPPPKKRKFPTPIPSPTSQPPTTSSSE